MNERIWLHHIRSVPVLDRVLWGGVLPAIPTGRSDVEPENPTEARIAAVLLAGCLCVLLLAAAIGRPGILACAIASLLAAQMVRLLSIRRYARQARHWRRVLSGRMNREHPAQVPELEADFSKLVLSAVFVLPAALALMSVGFAWLAWAPHPPMAVELLVFVQLVLLIASVTTMITCGWRLQRVRHTWDGES